AGSAYGSAAAGDACCDGGSGQRAVVRPDRIVGERLADGAGGRSPSIAASAPPSSGANAHAPPSDELGPRPASKGRGCVLRPEGAAGSGGVGDEGRVMGCGGGMRRWLRGDVGDAVRGGGASGTTGTLGARSDACGIASWTAAWARIEAAAGSSLVATIRRM